MIGKYILALAILATLSMQVDDEYCALNLEKNECISTTKLTNCCWLKFQHTYSFGGQPVNGCFDYRYVVGGLKFLISPKSFDTMSDRVLCEALGGSCESITLSNFNEIMKLASNDKNSGNTQIVELLELQCRSN